MKKTTLSRTTLRTLSTTSLVRVPAGVQSLGGGKPTSRDIHLPSEDPKACYPDSLPPWCA